MNKVFDLEIVFAWKINLCRKTITSYLCIARTSDKIVITVTESDTIVMSETTRS
jgi:hypothetical protein